MNKKMFILISILFLIVMSMNVFGALTDNILGYWDMQNNTIQDLTGYNNGIYGNGNFPIGKIGNAINVSNVFNSVNFTKNTRYTQFQNNKNFTFNVWLKPNLTGGNQYQIFISLIEYMGAQNGFMFGFENQASNQFVTYNGTIWLAWGTNSSPSMSNWQMYTINYNGSQLCLYINASLVECKAFAYIGSSNAILGINTWNTATNYLYQGMEDELGIWNRTLNASEISQLYNSGGGLPFSQWNQNFSVSAKSLYDNSSVSNFSIIMSNGSVNYTFSTITGTINTNISSSSNQLWNISFFNATNFFNATSLQVNVSSSPFQGNLSQYPILNVNDVWNNNNISNFNISDNLSGFYSTNSGIVYVPYNQSTSYTIQSSSYFNYTNTTSFNANMLYNISLYQSIINFSCFEKVSGNQLVCVNQTIYPDSGIYNFSVNVSGYYTRVTNNSVVSALDNKTINVSGFYSTNLSLNSVPLIATSLSQCSYNISGITYPSYNEVVVGMPNTSVGLINGSYNVVDLCNGSALSSQNITTNSITQSLNFSIYTVNSVNLTFVDVTTNKVMNGTNVSAQFIGGNKQTNYTTTGSLYVDLLIPSSYTLLSSASGYVQNTYLFSLANLSFNPITIYMQPSANNATYYVLFTVTDKLSRQPLQGAVVTIQRYVNNAWVTEQTYTTDFNGRGQGYFVLNTQYYNFVITYNGVTYSGNLNSDSNKKIIYYEDYLNGLDIEINLASTNYINTLQGLYSIDSSLKYVNTSNTTGSFVYGWQDMNGNSRTGNLSIYLNGVLNCSASASTATGGINCPVDSGNNEFFYSAYTWIDNIPDKSLTMKVGVSQELNFNWGIGGWIFTIFLVIIAFTAFAQVPAISIMLGTIFFALALGFNVLFAPNAQVSQLGIIIVFVAFLIAKIPSNSGVNS